MKRIDLILLKYGEIALKGLNRPVFERKLIDNIASAVSKIGKFSIRNSQSTIYLEPLEDGIDMFETIDRLQRIFGIVNICPVMRCEKTWTAYSRPLWNVSRISI